MLKYCVALLLVAVGYAQAQKAEPQMVRVRACFIEIDDASLKKTGLLKHFRRGLIRKGEMKDWQGLENAAKSFSMVEGISCSGEELYVSSIVEAAMPESFESPEMLITPGMRATGASQPVFGEPRDDLGTTLTVTPVVADGVITLPSHPKLVLLDGFHDETGKVTLKTKPFALFPIPRFKTIETRMQASLLSGDVLVQTLSYRGSRLRSGRYLLLSPTILEVPKVGSKLIPGKPASLRVTFDRVLVPGEKAKAFEQAAASSKGLTAMLESGKVEVLGRIETVVKSGDDSFSISMDEQMLPESWERPEFSQAPDDRELKPGGSHVSATVATPVFGEPRDDLGLSFTVAPALDAAKQLLTLEIHPKHVKHVGETNYSAPLRVKYASNKQRDIELKTKVTMPIFSSDEIRCKFAMRPGTVVILAKRGWKNSSRIKKGTYVSITDKDFEKLENAKKINYIYMIVRADYLYAAPESEKK